MQEVLRRLDSTQPSASDVRRELNAADMEAKERAYMEQICALLESTARAAPAAGTNQSRSERRRRPPCAVSSPPSPLPT